MFRYNPAANYQPNGGRYLQILSGKDLYKQTIVMSVRTHDTFPARFLNIFVDYQLGSMKVGDKLWTIWNKAPLKLWQTQLNFMVWCTSSACGVSSAHLNYATHPMIWAVYRFHVYYHVRRVLKRLQTPLPHKTSFNAADNPYTESEFCKICEDYRVPNDPMKYQDEKFYWTYQCRVHWPNDYIGPDSMTRWIIEASVDFTDVGLLRISESVRAYAYLILSSQASARSGIVGNTASALTAQSAFLNNFENVVNHRVDIREDIKCYQDTLSYASSKVDYIVGENLYMLPRELLGIIIKFSFPMVTLLAWGKMMRLTNVTQTAARPKRNSNDVLSHAPAISQKNQEPKTITHSDENIALVLFLTGGFAIWNIFR